MFGTFWNEGKFMNFKNFMVPCAWI